MLCDVCKKREATIHIKEVRNGKVISTNLCPECAKEKELAGGLGAFGFNLAEVIFNVGKGGEPEAEAAPEEKKEKGPALVCPVCNWNLSKMRKSGGKLGCSRCYTVFSKWVDKAAEQMQRGKVHVGRRPVSSVRTAASLQMEIDKLQLELVAAVSAEAYEKAARFRDRINLLKEELNALTDNTGGKE